MADYCCTTISGIAQDCLGSIGGIKRVWISCYDGVKTTVTDNMITAITGGSFKAFSFRPQTGSLTMNFTKDNTTGTAYSENTLVMQFTRLETAKKIEIDALLIGDVVCIVEDNNGKYWYLGTDNPVNLSEGSGETGTAFTDFNGYNITLIDYSKVHPFEVTQTVIDSITGSGSGSGL